MPDWERKYMGRWKMPTDDCIKRSDALKAILGVSIYDTIEELEGARTIAENTWADGLYDTYKIIEEEVDAANVEPVKHGYWVYKMRERNKCEFVSGFDHLGDWHTITVITHVKGPVPYCGLCGALAADSFLDYCPKCGAKMDKEADNGDK